MSNPSIFSRLLGRDRPAKSTSRSTRIQISPPKPWGSSNDSMWPSIWHWLRDVPHAGQRPPQGLDAARDAFTAALQDLEAAEAKDLRRRTRHANSLRELWHLRAELYGIVARHLNQTEADRRLAMINCHFPTRAPRGATNTTGLRDGNHRSA